jgi:hypothetical protein
LNLHVTWERRDSRPETYGDEKREKEKKSQKLKAGHSSQGARVGGVLGELGVQSQGSSHANVLQNLAYTCDETSQTRHRDGFVCLFTGLASRRHICSGTVWGCERKKKKEENVADIARLKFV